MNNNFSKKILIVTDFYTPHISGIVTYIDQMISFFKKKKFIVTVLTTKHNTDLKISEYHKSINIIRCNPTFSISRGTYSFELIKKFLLIYKNYDYINVHYPLTEIFPLIFLLKKKNTILNYHCLPEFGILNIIFKSYFYFFGLIATIKSKKTVVLSKDYFENIIFHKYFSFNLLEIPPFVNKYDAKLINFSKKKNKEIIIGFLGRICKEKGIEILLKLSDLFIKRNINHKILIAGNLNDKRFKKYIDNLLFISKNNKNIEFLNKINEGDKLKFFNRIDVFILPSVNSFEAFGIVQLEAMNHGVPVIATDIKGVRSVINKTSNGFLFKKNNVKELAEKILKIKDSNQLNKQSIIKKTKDNYNKLLFEGLVEKLF